MAIENRTLEAGTKLIAKYKKEEHRATVIAGEEEKLNYRLVDGREFKSLSSAGTAITNKACNGWTFWSVEPEDALTEPQEPETQRERNETSEETETGDQTPKPVFRRVPNQKGVGEGEVRLYCDTCQKSFTEPVGEPAEQSPEGHTPKAGQEATTEA